MSCHNTSHNTLACTSLFFTHEHALNRITQDISMQACITKAHDLCMSEGIPLEYLCLICISPVHTKRDNVLPAAFIHNIHAIAHQSPDTATFTELLMQYIHIRTNTIRRMFQSMNTGILDGVLRVSFLHMPVFKTQSTASMTWEQAQQFTTFTLQYAQRNNYISQHSPISFLLAPDTCTQSQVQYIAIIHIIATCKQQDAFRRIISHAISNQLNKQRNHVSVNNANIMNRGQSKSKLQHIKSDNTRIHTLQLYKQALAKIEEDEITHDCGPTYSNRTQPTLFLYHSGTLSQNDAKAAYATYIRDPVL